jgi:hypothetical protein
MLPDCIASGYSTKGHNGYARVPYKGKLISLTRLLYAQHHKIAVESLGDKVIMHTCDNPNCINLNHLKLGTQQENVQDMWNKGRQGVTPMQGSKHPMAKLNEQTVKEIKQNTRAAGKFLAKKYGVSVATISMIKNNKIWTHVL